MSKRKYLKYVATLFAATFFYGCTVHEVSTSRHHVVSVGPYSTTNTRLAYPARYYYRSSYYPHHYYFKHRSIYPYYHPYRYRSYRYYRW